MSELPELPKLQGINQITTTYKNLIAGCKYMEFEPFRCQKHVTIGYLIECSAVGNNIHQCFTEMDKFFNHNRLL